MVPALIGCRFVRLVPDGLHSKSLNAPRLAALIKSHKTALNVHSKCNQCSLKVQTNLSRNALKPCPKPLSHHPPCLLALSPAVSAPTSLCMRLPVACLATHALAIGTPWPLERLCTWHALAHHTTPYHTIPYHTTPYHTMPNHTIPYHTTPPLPIQRRCACASLWPVLAHTPWPLERLCTGHALAHHTIPYHTIPHHTTTYLPGLIHFTDI